MTAMRKAFEKVYPLPNGVYWDESGQRYLHDKEACSYVTIDRYCSLFEGWQASRQQPIALPNPPSKQGKCNDGARFMHYEIKQSLTAQGYAVAE